MKQHNITHILAAQAQRGNFPIALAYHMPACLVIPECPLCEEEHTHGGVDDCWRVALCFDTPYYVHLPADWYFSGYTGPRPVDQAKVDAVLAAKAEKEKPQSMGLRLV